MTTTYLDIVLEDGDMIRELSRSLFIKKGNRMYFTPRTLNDFEPGERIRVEYVGEHTKNEGWEPYRLPTD